MECFGSLSQKKLKLLIGDPGCPTQRDLNEVACNFSGMTWIGSELIAQPDFEDLEGEHEHHYLIR